MSGQALSLYRERIWRFALRAGWAGAGGLCLLVLAAIVAQFADRMQAERRTALAEERAQLLRGERREAPTVDLRAQLESFYARFPIATELPARLSRLNDIATAHGVGLPRTDYRSAVEGGTPLLEIGLAIPLTAPLPVLYGWLAEVSREMPEVALESLVLKRPGADSDSVEADVRLSLFLRGRS